MSPAELCAQLLHCRNIQEWEALLSAEGVMSDPLRAVLDQARSVMSNAPQEALELAAVTAAVACARQDFLTAAAAGRVQGQAYRLQGRHLEAIQAFRTAADSARQAGDPKLAAQVQIGCVDSLGMIGRYDEAIVLARSLETALRAEGAEEDAARVLFNAGSLHFRRDQYARALECYERAGQILERGDDPTVLARIRSNCANALTHLNRLDEAITLYDQARLLFVERGMTEEIAFIDTNLGFLHYVSGKHALAVSSLTRARREFQERGREIEAARCAIDLGEAYRALNLFPEARECYTQAIPVLERLSVDYDRARAEMGLAATLMACGEQEKAAESLHQADLIFRKQRNTLQVAHVRLIHAYLLHAGDRKAAAEQEAHAAARAFTRHRLPGWAAEARFLPAEMALEQDENVSRTMQSVVRVARKTARGWLECRAEHALGRYYARKGDLKSALRHLRNGAKVLQEARTLIAPEEMHVAFLRDKMILYEDLVGTLLARGRPRDIEEALECVEQSKSRLLLERIEAAWDGRFRPRKSEEAALAKLAGLRSALSRDYHLRHALPQPQARRFAQGSAAEIDALIPMERAYNESLQDVESAFGSAVQADSHKRVSVKVTELGALLQSDETLVEFYTVRDQICAFIVSPTGIRILPGIAGLEDVKFAARRLRYQLQRLEMPSEYATLLKEQLLADIREVLGHLYELLLRPLEGLLVEKVIIAPHGILHELPFHAFFDGQVYALDLWEILYAPSATVWHKGVEQQRAYPKPAPPHETNRLALVMGIPDAGTERIAEEVEEVTRCLPGAKVFCGAEATLETFYALSEQSEILHLATHARFRNDNPLFSGLKFTDGWLLARDLYGMNLDCDLATLSACQTGATVVEAGDELFGLIRGFLGAGARSVAASLWAADDAATALLMESFYTRIAQGESTASALRGAQQRTREVYPHPYYWAAFGLVGQRERNAEMGKKRGERYAAC
jgi:CHAT domain-containing protein